MPSSAPRRCGAQRSPRSQIHFACAVTKCSSQTTRPTWTCTDARIAEILATQDDPFICRCFKQFATCPSMIPWSCSKDFTSYFFQYHPPAALVAPEERVPGAADNPQLAADQKDGIDGRGCRTSKGNEPIPGLGLRLGAMDSRRCGDRKQPATATEILRKRGGEEWQPPALRHSR